MSNRIPLLALAAVFSAGLGAAPAQAGSIVYVKDSNVWLASDDGSNQYQVTTDGTTTEPYRSPSQANDGTIVALRRGTGVRMKQNGQRLSPDFLSDARATSVAVTPDGAVVAYSYLCTNAGGTLTQCTSYRSTATGEQAAPQAGQFYAPSWIDDLTAVMSAGSSVWVHTTGQNARQWWADHDHAVFATTEQLGDVEAAAGRIALVRGSSSSVAGSTIQTYTFTATTGLPEPRCTIGNPVPGPGGEAVFRDPTWSPDGSTLAWQEGDGVWIATGFTAAGGCPSNFPTGAAIAGGSDPDWGPAPNAPGPRPQTTTGGGSGAVTGDGSGTAGGGSGATGGSNTVAGGGTAGTVFGSEGPVTPLKLGTALKRGVSVPVSCPTSCAVTVKAAVDKRTARQLRLGKKALAVGSGKGSVAGPGTGAVNVRFSAKARKRMGRAKKVRVTFEIAATGGDRQVQRVKRSVTLKR